MKIGNPADKPHAAATQGSHAAASEAAKAVTTAAAPAAAAPSAAASATVALSSTASTLLSGGASGEFDAEKVRRIGEAIAGGTFKVNHAAIADKLISNAQELLAKVKS